MTSFSPSIQIRRLVVERHGRRVYDEAFHEGINIIRGENSSGKSTILNMIFYGLGGNVVDWSETALLCDTVVVEALFNGKYATISRPISEKSMQPMNIIGCPFDEAMKAPASEWLRFPYRRSEGSESFSQNIFRLLDLPEASNDDSGNITMHQILRLLYADQLSPVESIFKFEAFDNASIREAVGRLLCGAFDNELYENQLAIRQLEKKYDASAQQLNSLYTALGSAGHNLTLNWVHEERVRLENDRIELGNSLIDIQRGADADEADEPSQDAIDASWKSLVDAQEAFASSRSERDALQFAIADSDEFMSSLQSKLSALKDANLTRHALGSAHFDTCPACYTELSKVEDGTCAVCKEPIGFDDHLDRVASMISEAALQFRQSKLLQENRRSRLTELEAKLAEAYSTLLAATRHYSEIKRRPSTQREYRISEIYKALGYIDRREEDIAEKAKIIEVIASLSEQKATFNLHLATLKDRNEQLELAQEDRLRRAYTSVSDEVRALLKHDLRRQDSFESAERVNFDFGQNSISVDGHTYFSASSRVILKSSFFLGFYAAAANIDYFRHPRLCILDTIEDKGMEPIRSHNFQEQILRIWNESSFKGQIIFATVMISEALDREEFTVGRFSTLDAPTLDIH
jgi:AAA domain-containing protein